MFNLLAWAEKFVATPSVSRDGNAAIARLAADMLREIGLEPRLVPARHEGVEHFNLIADVPLSAHARERAGDGLILLTHLDTVPPGESEDWTATGGDPFQPTRDGDRLFGLGSADAKVDLVCKAAALAQTDWSRLRSPIRVVGTFGEEIGLVGARHFVTTGGAEGFRYALVGEPSELAGIRAHKGYAVFEAVIPLTPVHDGRPVHDGSLAIQELEIRGQTAHSSTPHLGRNAIDAALERLAQADTRSVHALDAGTAVNVVPARATLQIGLRATQNSVASASPTEPAKLGRGYDPTPLVDFHRAWRALLAQLAETRDADFDPAHTVGNLGRIELRDDRCVIRFDLRPVPGVDAAEAVRPLERHAKLQLVRQNPPLNTAPNGALVRAVQRAQSAAGLAPRILTKATCTEAGLLAQSGRLEVIVLGAGLSVGNVHRPNEHTRISELGGACNLYRELIQMLCMEAA